MSFISSSGKPKLVESKLIRYYVEKNKMKELIKQADIMKEIEIQNEIKPLYHKIGRYVLTFFKQNYGFCIVITLLIILLYLRYIEVVKRKKLKLETQSN